MPAGRVFDEVGERLGHRRARDPSEEIEHLSGVASGVECASHSGGTESVDDGTAGALHIRHEAQLASEVREKRPGSDGREIGLEQDVVKGRRHCRAHSHLRVPRIGRR